VEPLVELVGTTDVVSTSSTGDGLDRLDQRVTGSTRGTG